MKPIDCEGIYRNAVYYDAMHQGYDEDLPFYLKMMGENPGPLLELACGTGRLACRLAGENRVVAGLDISKYMLEKARLNAAILGVHVEFYLADCREFDLPGRFANIIFPFNSIAHLHDTESIEGCFRSVQRHLAFNGRFIIDIYNPNLHYLVRDPNEKFLVSRFEDPSSGKQIRIVESNTYDHASQVNHLKWYYYDNDSHLLTTEDLNMRIFYPQELDALLRYNGFRILAKFGDYDETPYSSSSKKQLFVAIKE